MKTNNFRNIIAIATIALVASVNTVSAQRDTVYIVKETVAPAAVIGAAATANNQQGCLKPRFKEGRLFTDRHCGWKPGIEALYNTTRYTSDLEPDGKTTSGVGVAVSFDYDWCQKEWAIAPTYGVYVGGMTSRTYESLETGFNVFGGMRAGIVIAPHSARIKLCGLMQFNCITHSNVNGDPHKLYVPQFGGEISGDIRIANRVRSGVTEVYGHPVQTVEQNPIFLTYFARVTTWKTSKKWDSSQEGEHKISGVSIEVGLRVSCNLNIYKKH